MMPKEPHLNIQARPHIPRDSILGDKTHKKPLWGTGV